VGIGELGDRKRARSTVSSRVRTRWVVAGCMAGILGVQAGVLSAEPFRWRTAASSLLPLAMFAGWAAMFIWSIRRRHANMSMLSAAKRESERRADPPADGVSIRMLLACESARRGASAVWIAEHCELPVALAELVVADERGRTQHPDPSAG
jgi:hypothetical protein